MMTQIKDFTHIHKIIKIDKDFFPYSWTEDQWRKLDLDNHKILTFEEKDEVLGFILCLKNELSGFWHLLKIVVVPNARRQGIAQKLLNDFIKDSNSLKILLEVSTINESAIKFYQKNGFKILHHQKKFYSDGCDAYIMMRE